MNVVYTIGYEGTDIDRFIATLKTVGVTVLADVRAVPVSRKKGFSKNGLRQRLDAEGIAYVHLVELGDPKPGRDAARAGRHEEFRRVYAQHLKSADALGALKVLDEAARNDSVCLLCFERDPTVCHRKMIADRLNTRGFQIFDLYGDEPNRYVRHAEKLPRRRSRKSNAESQPEVW
ncbi:DUF488 family protein [Methylosinus sporium]|uniref:DUF488 domain-containing protein n=1 Tax=Methylosinus sporium TaxID=428 RepID=UPI00383BBD6C